MDVRVGVVVTMLLVPLVAPLTGVPASATSCAFPVTISDATGTEVTVQEEPQRVVTLSPSGAQTMWEIGAREKVVGVTRHAEYLDGAESRARVSTNEQLVSIETVINLTPDLVLAPNLVSIDTVAKLREAGLTVYYFPPAESIKDVYHKTRRIGRLTGECEGANATVSRMQDQINLTRQAVERQERPDVVYLFFGYTAGKGTFINEIIETAGGNNIAVDANISGYKQLSPEHLIQADPDWIILNSENPAGISPEVLNQTTAGRQNKTVIVEIEHLNQPAPRLVHAITALAKRFHPDAYAAANSTEMPATPTGTTTTPTESSVTPTPTPSLAPTTTGSPGQPGFGFVVGLLGPITAIGCYRKLSQ